MKRLLICSFIILSLFSGCASSGKRAGAVVMNHERAGIDIERKTEKIKLHTPRIFWQDKNPDTYQAMDRKKIRILQEAFNKAVSNAGYFEIVERSSQGTEFIDTTLTIDHFNVQLKNEDGMYERSGSIGCSLKIKDEGRLLGGSSDNYSETAEYQRVSPELADLDGSSEALKTLAEDVAKKLTAQISPTKKVVFREFEKGGNADNNHGVDAAMNSNWDAALKYWNEAIHECNSCPQAYFNKGVFYELGGDTEQAQRFYNIAFELSPGSDKYSRIKGEIDHEARIVQQYKQMEVKKNKNKHDTGGF